jgi:hypothetical protein
VWKLVLFCLMKEKNDYSFEDHKRTVVELNAFFFLTLYQGTVTFEFFRFPIFHDFFDVFFISNQAFFLYISCMLFNNFQLLFKK